MEFKERSCQGVAERRLGKKNEGCTVQKGKEASGRPKGFKRKEQTRSEILGKERKERNGACSQDPN
jgi:hypothetical protein